MQYVPIEQSWNIQKHQFRHMSTFLCQDRSSVLWFPKAFYAFGVGGIVTIFGALVPASMFHETHWNPTWVCVSNGLPTIGIYTRGKGSHRFQGSKRKWSWLLALPGFGFEIHYVVPGPYRAIPQNVEAMFMSRLTKHFCTSCWHKRALEKLCLGKLRL